MIQRSTVCQPKKKKKSPNGQKYDRWPGGSLWAVGFQIQRSRLIITLKLIKNTIKNTLKIQKIQIFFL